MSKNKSIDGLAVRTTKNSASPVKPAKKKPQANNLIPDDSVEIKVQTTEDFLSPVKPLDVTTEESPKEKPEEESATLKTEAPVEVEPAKPTAKPEEKMDKKAKKVKKPKSKGAKIATIIITSILAVILVGLIGVTVAVTFWGNDIIAKITGGRGNVLDLLSFTSETYEPLKTDANGRTNILAFGTSGYNMEGDEGNGIHAGAQLTDSIMMISFNQETGDIAMLSLPRDLKASPTCTRTGKINEVYWCNGGGGNATVEEEAEAASALMGEVGSILGVDFQYFAHLNWGSLVQIVDTLGGIEVTLDEDIDDDWWTGAVYEAGVTYHLNGEEALGLARARHGTAGGDFSRGASQQKILIGIKDKALEHNFSMADILNFANIMGDNVRTNLSVQEMRTAAHLAGEFDFDSMRQLTLYPAYMTTGMIDGISYVLPRAGVGNYGAIQEYVAAGLSNDPRSYEYPTILVLNATDTVGLASTERKNLLEDGYTSIEIGDAPEGEYVKGYSLYSNHTKPGTEDMLENHYYVEAWDYADLPAGISKDYDFVIIINTSTENTQTE